MPFFSLVNLYLSEFSLVTPPCPQDFPAGRAAREVSISYWGHHARGAGRQGERLSVAGWWPLYPTAQIIFITSESLTRQRCSRPCRVLQTQEQRELDSQLPCLPPKNENSSIIIAFALLNKGALISAEKRLNCWFCIIKIVNWSIKEKSPPDHLILSSTEH